MAKTIKRVITLTKPYLVENSVLKAGSKILVETEGEYFDTVSPPGYDNNPVVDSNVYSMRRSARRIRRFDEPLEDRPFEEEEGDDLINEEEEVKAELNALRRLRRIRALRHRMEKDEDLKEAEDKEEEEEKKAMRRIRRIRRRMGDEDDLKEEEMDDLNGTPAGNEGAFEGEIADDTVNLLAMRRRMRMRRLARMKKAEKDELEEEEEDEKKED